jgi:hypothetical protein
MTTRSVIVRCDCAHWRRLSVDAWSEHAKTNGVKIRVTTSIPTEPVLTIPVFIEE